MILALLEFLQHTAFELAEKKRWSSRKKDVGAHASTALEFIATQYSNSRRPTGDPGEWRGKPTGDGACLESR